MHVIARTARCQQGDDIVPERLEALDMRLDQRPSVRSYMLRDMKKLMDTLEVRCCHIIAAGLHTCCFCALRIDI